MTLSKYDLRIARADHLAGQHSFATQVLTFFEQLTRLQARLYSEIESVPEETLAETLTALRQGDFPANGIQRFPDFLSRLKEISPEPLSEVAQHLRRRNTNYWRDLFRCSWQNTPAISPDSTEAAIGRMFLQPFAEFLADKHKTHPNSRVPGACPFCFQKPLVGVLRPEGDGGKRSLVCSMCATEWHCGRILCPACGEQEVDQLAVYSTDQFSHVRIEACDTCHHFIKTVDLTKTGRAIPVVDELATIPLSLWAADHGYTKFQVNVLGL